MDTRPRRRSKYETERYYMKTATDITEMKTNSCNIFGDQYTRLIRTLEDIVLSKPDSHSRLLAELKKWDNASRQVVLQDLAAALTADECEPLLEII